MSRLTRDGTAEPVSREKILRHARGQGNIHFPCSADHEQDWQPYPVDPYSAIRDDHTYIHTYILLVLKVPAILVLIIYELLLAIRLEPSKCLSCFASIPAFFFNPLNPNMYVYNVYIYIRGISGAPAL